MKCDLHTHSYYSDGLFSPREVVRLAKKRGIKILALTDHNSVLGVEEAVNEGKKLGIRVIPAIELNSRDAEVLGYFIDYRSRELKRAAELGRYYAHERTKRRILAMRKIGVNVSYNDFIKKFPHSKGNCNNSMLATLLEEKYSKEDVDKFFDDTAKMYRKPRKKEISTVSAVRLIRKIGGAPVIAHPWIYQEVLKQNKMKNLMKAGLAGIEFDNGDGNNKFRGNKWDKKMKSVAKKYKLILTLGSDYHGLKMWDGTGHDIGKTYCGEKTVRLLEDAR